MALIIEGGISIGGNITIAAEYIDSTTNLVVFYDAGNSMSYSGSGISFNTSYTGPNLTTYTQFGVLDLAGLTGGPWNSGFLTTSGDPIGWTSQGVSSYWTLNATDTQYINSTYQQDAGSNSIPTLNSSTYTIVSVVRPQDFAQGAIVGGDENIFFFNPVGGLNDGPALMASNTYSFPAVIDTTTAYELNTWYCVAVTYDADSRTMKLYTNGALVATNTDVDPPTHPTGLYWGTLEGELWYTGDMAVCMTYERVLGASEISQLSDVYLSRYIAPTATSSIISTPPYYGPPIWTVPEGVTSISVVAVGAGGGGTQDSYSPPGGDSVMTKLDNSVTGIPTTFTGTSDTIIVDTTAYPNIANVQATGSWIVSGSDIAGQAPAFDLVTGVDTDGSNTTITINNTITTTAGDTFEFYEAVVAAEGGYEINDSYYSANPELSAGWGPGPRAQPLVTDGPYGAGGVVDWTDTWPIGGGGGGGYGIDGLALNINQAGEWFFNGDPYHTMTFSNNNLTVTALPGMGASQANQECMVLGTELIPEGPSKIMYSVNVSQTAGIGYTGVGLANYNESLWQYPGYSFDSVGYFDSGNVYINGALVDTFSTFNEGGLIDIAVDLSRGEAWFRVNGGNWNASGSADPATGVGGLNIAAVANQGPMTLALGPWYDDTSSTADVISVAITSTYAVPEGFTFVPGVAGAGGTGGDGASDYGPTAMPGTGGSSGGGGGREFDSGGGGGGTGLYGRGISGTAGSFYDTNSVWYGIATGGGGGSNNVVADGKGGQATPWNGGRGGWPGGGGGSATDYYDGGNGGALAYRNNYEVTPGESYFVFGGQGGIGQNNGGSGANGAVRIIWPGDTRQFPDTNCGPDEVAVPTLDITGHNFPNFSTTGTLDWSITNNGGAVVLETGVVWGLPGQATYLDSTDVCDGSSSTAERKAIRDADSCSNPPTVGLSGAQTLNFNVALFDNDEIQVRAYARNDAGVAYSATTLTWTPVICLAEGTLVTLANGSTKAIETVTMSDLIKVWDFDNAAATSAIPLWIKKKESTAQYNLIKFSDGSELKTIGQHRIFNKQAGAFTYPMTNATPVGTVTVNSAGVEVTVTSKQVVYEAVNYYNVVTAGGYMNLYANSILTSMRYNNIYPVTNMQYSKDDRALRNRSEFAGIADRWIDGLRLLEQTIDIKHIKKYVARLEANEAKETPARTSPSWNR